MLAAGLWLLPALGVAASRNSILPIQVLWINMTTGGVLGLFLALEPKERDLMQRPPRAPGAPILTGRMLAQVALAGVLILIAAFGLFKWELARGAGLEAARTVALNTVAVIQALYLVNCRSLRHSILSIGLFRNGVAGSCVVLLLLLAALGLAGWDLIRKSRKPLALTAGLIAAGPLQAGIRRWGRRLERETGIEPATNSLEGCDSTIELLPPAFRRSRTNHDTARASRSLQLSF